MLIADTNQWHPLVDGKAYFSAWPVIIIRVTDGLSITDTAFVSSLAQARAANGVVGFYHYLTANDDAAAQGNFFAQVLRAHGGLKRGDFIVCDDEEGSGNQTPRMDAFLATTHGLLSDQISDEWGYSGEAFWAAHLVAEGHHKWIAAYGQASAPPGAQLWQFTDARNMPGIQGPCDCSIFNGTFLQFQELNGVAAPAPSDPPPTISTVEVDDMQVHGFAAEVPVGPNGEGFAVFDGGKDTVPGASSLSPAIPMDNFLGATAWGPEPTRDADWGPIQVDCQVDGDFLFLHVRNAPKHNPAANETVAWVTYWS